MARASTNLIHRFESKLEAQNAKLDARTAKFNLLLWFIGIGVAILAAVGAYTVYFGSTPF